MWRAFGYTYVSCAALRPFPSERKSSVPAHAHGVDSHFLQHKSFPETPDGRMAGIDRCFHKRTLDEASVSISLEVVSKITAARCPWVRCVSCPGANGPLSF